MACCVNPVKGTNKIGSIGMPLPDVDVRIVDAEDGVRELAVGEVGETDHARAAVHDGILEQPGRDRGGAARRTATARRGCTPAIWPTWTRMATCSSSTARRT